MNDKKLLDNIGSDTAAAAAAAAAADKGMILNALTEEQNELSLTELNLLCTVDRLS